MHGFVSSSDGVVSRRAGITLSIRYSKQLPSRPPRISASATLLLATAMAGVATWLLPKTERDYWERGRLSPEASVAGWGLYLTHAALTMGTALRSYRSLPRGKRPSAALEAAAALSGLAFYGAAMREFRSFEQVSGTEAGNLVKTGPYRYSRNPQVIGWGLALLGAAVAGRSAGALVSAAGFFLVHGRYFDVEERHLERVFGEEYRRYLEKTPRWFGLPGKG